jgi:DNA-binding transcriptional ArsR family regulator
MRYEIAADCAADVTNTVTHNLEALLSGTALLLFRALHTSAVEVSVARRYHPNVSQVSFFCPVEAVALALGVHRCTVYRALPELRALGLVDVRAHYTTHRGRTVADGSVWAVRLRPVGGRAARVGYGDLKRQYRNLSGDVETGRTVWAEMQQSKDNSSRGLNLDLIRRWALPPQNLEKPVAFDCRTAPRRDLEAVLDVQHAPREARGAAVDLAAQALAAALSDQGGVNFYRRLLWQLLRRSDAVGADHFYGVYLAAQRASVDAREGFARRPGALFTSRLKGAQWFEEVMRGAGRVGPTPVTMRA